MIDITLRAGNARELTGVVVDMSLRRTLSFRRQQRVLARALASAPTPAARSELRVLLNPR